MSCSQVDPCAVLNPGGCNINVSTCFSHRKVSKEEDLARNFCRRVTVFIGVPGSFPIYHYRAYRSLMAKALCPLRVLNGCLCIFPQAECVQTGPGEHRCVCQAGWSGDGRDCSAINNCLLPTTARCHKNATCIYIGPGQVGPCIQCHLQCMSSTILFCQSLGFLSCFLPQSLLSPLQQRCYFHRVLSTQNSLPKFQFQCLCGGAVAANTFLEST